MDLRDRVPRGRRSRAPRSRQFPRLEPHQQHCHLAVGGQGASRGPMVIFHRFRQLVHSNESDPRPPTTALRLREPAGMGIRLSSRGAGTLTTVVLLGTLGTTARAQTGSGHLSLSYDGGLMHSTSVHLLDTKPETAVADGPEIAALGRAREVLSMVAPATKRKGIHRSARALGGSAVARPHAAERGRSRPATRLFRADQLHQILPPQRQRVTGRVPSSQVVLGS